MCGLRLVLTAGIPTGWGESAKAILNLKKISFIAISQEGGGPNKELIDWTGTRLAPVAVYEDEAPRPTWDGILLMAEKLKSEPRLVPVDPFERARMFGLAHEICGQDGFGWNRRLIVLDRASHILKEVPRASQSEILRMRDEFGLFRPAIARAPSRVIEILGMLTQILKDQKAAGSRYFIGSTMTALDIYWACFSIMIDPMSEEQNPMREDHRMLYTAFGDDIRDAVDPILMEHRDMMFQEHLKLPLDF